MAMFVDPDTETPVKVLDSCITADNPARFQPSLPANISCRKFAHPQRPRFPWQLKLCICGENHGNTSNTTSWQSWHWKPNSGNAAVKSPAAAFR